ncbi:MAG: sulfatase-like hydrolase/transferase [Verrucomicrobiaceae bacterium]|nr:sulfatase-like hydrolase/transferase [Verrucomicrobiaceae bacterium]
MKIVLTIYCLLACVCFAAERPNVLFLFADDYSYEAVRSMGMTDIDTPNLDKLAARGTTFTHAYNMGSWSGAVCVASRTMLITGRSVWSANAVYKTTDNERKSGMLWPQLMKQAGYRTYMTGKWHIQTDADQCFDVTRDVRAGMPKTVPSSYNRPLAGQTDAWSPFDPSLGGYWEGGKHWSEVVANDTNDFLKDAAGKKKPFFIYAAFNAPHDPRQAPKEFLDRYPTSRLEVPKNFLPQYPHANEIGCAHKLRDENLAPMPRTEHSVKVHRSEYYALITHLDQQIGRILDALDQQGLTKNTWIFFTADHGLAVGHHGLFGKQNMYDHSVRVPFIVSGPGVMKGAKIDSAIYLQDVMATAVDLAGAKKPPHVYFNTLVPFLNGSQAKSNYDSVYGAYLDLQRAITHDGWKLIAYPKAKVLRLYDLKSDPSEQIDLANSPEHSSRKRELLTRLVRQSADLGDSVNLESVFGHPES